MAITRGYDGIYFPSVRTDGQGFNLAIKPEIVNQKLKLVYAGECTIFKGEKKVIFNNNTETFINGRQTTFDYTEIPIGERRIERSQAMIEAGIEE